MSVKHIDESIELWNQRLGSAAQNLLDLQSHPVYKRISASDAKVSGATAEQSESAVLTLRWLLQFFDLLQGAVSRAEELRRDMPAYFGAEEREREIAELLQGRSIQLPAAQIPFGKRSLSGASANATSIAPAELLTTMETAFEEAKAIVLSLDAAWEALGRSVQRAYEQLEVLKAESANLDPQDCAALESAAERLDKMSQLAGEDPLGSAAQAVAGIEQSLARLQARLEQARKQRQQAKTELADAEKLLHTFEEQRQGIKTKCEEAFEKTSFLFDCDESERRIAGLRAWLERLRIALETAQASAVLIGLRNWNTAARQVMNDDVEAARKAESQLALRSELRGRLDALKAKARAYGVAEHDELCAVAERAKRLLFARPTPLGEAAQAVAEYESRLNSEAGKIV